MKFLKEEEYSRTLTLVHDRNSRSIHKYIDLTFFLSVNVIDTQGIDILLVELIAILLTSLTNFI